jgi:hypothetical protein
MSKFCLEYITQDLRLEFLKILNRKIFYRIEFGSIDKIDKIVVFGLKYLKKLFNKLKNNKSVDTLGPLIIDKTNKNIIVLGIQQKEVVIYVNDDVMSFLNICEGIING